MKSFLVLGPGFNCGIVDLLKQKQWHGIFVEGNPHVCAHLCQSLQEYERAHWMLIPNCVAPTRDPRFLEVREGRAASNHGYLVSAPTGDFPKYLHFPVTLDEIVAVAPYPITYLYCLVPEIHNEILMTYRFKVKPSQLQIKYPSAELISRLETFGYENTTDDTKYVNFELQTG